jgi:hypothetical protein
MIFAPLYLYDCIRTPLFYQKTLPLWIGILDETDDSGKTSWPTLRSREHFLKVTDERIYGQAFIEVRIGLLFD